MTTYLKSTSNHLIGSVGPPLKKEIASIFCTQQRLHRVLSRKHSANMFLPIDLLMWVVCWVHTRSLCEGFSSGYYATTLHCVTTDAIFMLCTPTLSNMSVVDTRWCTPVNLGILMIPISTLFLMPFVAFAWVHEVFGVGGKTCKKSICISGHGFTACCS